MLTFFLTFVVLATFLVGLIIAFYLWDRRPVMARASLVLGSAAGLFMFVLVVVGLHHLLNSH